MIAWQNFYMLVGAAAATLIGLMFVAITFGASTMGKIENPEITRAFLDPTLTHFVQVLLTSCFMLVPSISPVLLGALLAVVAIVRIVSLARVHRHMKTAQKRSNDIELSDWLQGIFIPLAMHVLLIVGAALFVLGGGAALAIVATVTTVTLLNGIYGAWELVVWIALTRSQK